MIIGFLKVFKVSPLLALFVGVGHFSSEGTALGGRDLQQRRSSPGLLNCGGAVYSFAVSTDKQIATAAVSEGHS